MGVRNLRAICPNCGGKIHTQPKGLGHFTWANSWMLVQTGSECQHCGVALSGKVGPGNKAILADDAEKTWWERETGAPSKQRPAAAAEPDTPLAPRLSREHERSLTLECEQPGASPDVLYAALHRAVLKLGYRITESQPDERRLSFKTPMSFTTGRLHIHTRVTEGEEDCSMLIIERPLIPVFSWGQKNLITRQLLGAVMASLPEVADPALSSDHFKQMPRQR